jgi:predicted PurR-regulated permease PerM
MGASPIVESPVMRKEAAPAASPAPRSESARRPEPARVLLDMPLDVRNLALVVITVLASAFALQWAKAVFIPLLLGVIFSYALTPAVDLMHRWRVPRAAGAGLLLAAIVTAIGWGVCSLRVRRDQRGSARRRQLLGHPYHREKPGGRGARRMSPFAVFVSVLVFGWLRGVWGLLLGVPILRVVKTICDRVDELNGIGELLGD